VSEVELAPSELNIYNEFNSKVKLLQSQIESNDESAKATFGSLMSMFGFNRHYCAVSGVPIIGQYYRIGTKTVCKEVYDSYQIFQELEMQNKSAKKPIVKKPAVKKEVKREKN
jgi:hypothetical protein